MFGEEPLFCRCCHGNSGVRYQDERQVGGFSAANEMKHQHAMKEFQSFFSSDISNQSQRHHTSPSPIYLTPAPALVGFLYDEF